MSEYLTLDDRVKSQDISIDTDKLKEQMQSKGINPIGYTHVDDRYIDLYAADDGFDIAFNGCIADLSGARSEKVESGEAVEEPIEAKKVVKNLKVAYGTVSIAADNGIVWTSGKESTVCGAATEGFVLDDGLHVAGMDDGHWHNPGKDPNEWSRVGDRDSYLKSRGLAKSVVVVPT